MARCSRSSRSRVPGAVLGTPTPRMRQLAKPLKRQLRRGHMRRVCARGAPIPHLRLTRVALLRCARHVKRCADGAFRLAQVAARALCVLALDRFDDFASCSGGATAPVRAGAAQLVALLLVPRARSGPSRNLRAELVRARALGDAAATLSRATRWEARHGAMLLLECTVALLAAEGAGGEADACEWIRQRARAVASTALRCAGDIDSDDVRSGAARVLLALPDSDTVFSNDDMPAIVTSTSTAACALLAPLQVSSPRLPRASRVPGLFACEPGSLCTAHSRVHRRRECRRPRALGVAGACRWRSQHAR